VTADASPPAWNGYVLPVACRCGVVFERWVTPEDADADLVRIARAELAALRITANKSPVGSLAHATAFA
jgi:hypothetical protein